MTRSMTDDTDSGPNRDLPIDRLATIRAKLTWLVVFCVLPVAIGVPLLVTSYYQRERAQLEREMILTARALSAALDLELAAAMAASRTLATSERQESGDLAGFHAQAGAVLRASAGDIFVLSDATGQQLVNTRRPFGEALPLHGDPAMMHRVFENGRAVISDVFIGGVQQRPLISIDVPVFRHGQVIYDLSIGILPERLSRVLGDRHLPPGWIAAAFDSKGIIVARTAEPDKFVGRPGTPILVERMRANEEGLSENNTLEGIPVFGAFTRLASSGWSVAVGVPKEALFGPLRNSILMISTGLLALLAAGCLSAWIVGGRIAASVRALTAPALALGSGEPVVAPRLAIRETEEVARALAGAARLLCQRTGERAAAQEAQREAQRLFSDVIDASTSLITLYDPDGKCLLANRTILDLFGKTAAQIIGRDRLVLLPAAAAEAQRAHDLAVLEGGTTKVVEEVVPQADGPHTYLTVKFPVRDQQGRLYAVGGIATDITERKRSEAELDRYRRHLEAELDQFAYISSHDLREPLRLISIYLAMIERRLGPQLDGDLREFFDFAIAGAKRMDALILDVLEFSRIGHSERPFRQVDLAAVIAECLGQVEDGEARIVVADGLPQIWGDRRELLRLFRNLIGNAIKFRAADRPPTIDIGYRDEGGHWVLWVRDNGIGIAEDQHERAFRIFQRLVPPGKYDGTGIGLAICRKVAEHHGGRIWIESVPGEGSTFFVALAKS